VFVEKPLALSVSDGKLLVDLAREQDLVLMVGHLLRYHPAIAKLKEIIDSGGLGRIQYVYSHRLNLGRFRSEESVLWSFAPHDIDVIISLLGMVPQTVACFGGAYLNEGVADTTVTNMAFSGGVRAHIFVSWLNPFKEQRLVIIGERAMAVFNDVATSDRLIIYDQPVSWEGGIPSPQRNGAQSVAFEWDEPLKLECQHFLDCIVMRRRPLTDGVSALDALAVLNAAQDSLQRGGAVVSLK